MSRQGDRDARRLDFSRDADPPTKLRGLRACMDCRLLQTSQQFTENGCRNCKDNTRDPLEYTTPVWKGVLAMMQPTTSWVAKWQHQVTYVRGLYAMDVVGQKTFEEHDGDVDGDGDADMS